jgi:hypothetical protein
MKPRTIALRMSRAACLSLLLSGAVAQAQQPAPPTQQPAPAPGAPAAQAGEGQEGPKVKVEKGAGGKTVYRITEAIRIEGKIQKPEAFYVLQKSSINYDWQDLKQDFVPKIVDSVTRAPF